VRFLLSSPVRILRRRDLLLAGFGFAAAARAANGKLPEGNDVVRGRFETPGVLTTPQGKKITLTGDDPTKLVLNDKRLNGMDVEVVGVRQGDGFSINPIHLRGVWVYRGGERLMVTYWCDICYIRTYSPGECWCCQEDTRFDPKDPNSKDPTP
jgi:hypothetical protein